MKFIIRDMRAGEESFFIDSWMHQAPYTLAATGVSPGVLREGQRTIVEAVLVHPAVHVLVAHLPDVDGEVCAWAAFDTDALHFIYTKADYRRQGAATALLARVRATSCSSMTKRAAAMRWSQRFTYNPFLAHSLVRDR